MRITKAYLDDIPEVYRDILTSIYNIGPSLSLAWDVNALIGYGGLNIDHLRWPINTSWQYLTSACDNLVENNILCKVKSINSATDSYIPTENGKLLIEAIVGKSRQSVPKFTPPNSEGK